MFSYRWEDIDRHNFSEEHTQKTSYIVSSNTRISKDLRLHLHYKTTHVRRPLHHAKQHLCRKHRHDITSRKRESNLYILELGPFFAFSLNSSIRYTDLQNSRYNLDEDLYEFVISAWYVPFERTTLTCSFTTFKNDIDTGGPYKTFHVDEMFYENMPYENKSNTIYLGCDLPGHVPPCTHR